MKTSNFSGIQILTILIATFMLCSFSCNPFPVKATPIAMTSPPPDASKNIKIALLLDTSNSMDGLIDQAKSQLWKMVNELAQAKCGDAKPSLQIALYEYGNDNLPSSEGFIRQVTPLTSDLDQISKDLFNLKTLGGDEYCGMVIQTALRQLEWDRQGKDLQLIFIAGNEPFTQGNTSYKAVCTDAKEKRITVNTIYCGNFDEGVQTSWKDGADLTGGNYMSIEQNLKTVYIQTPYDQQISDLNMKLNDTYIPYGQEGNVKYKNQAVQDANADSYGVANTVQRAVSKTSHLYSNESWDLVDYSESKEFSIEKVKKEELPAELKGKNNTELMQYIQEKKNSREKIKEEIGVLNQKRVQYISTQKTESGDDQMLDKAMLKSIRKQAEAKDFVF